MKKFVTLLIIAAAWYFAGMNRQPYVMAAAICGMIFVVFSFVFARVQKHFLSADLPDQENVIYKDHENPLVIHTENRSRLPVNRYRVTVLMRYKGSKNSSLRKLNGSAGRRNDNKENISVLYYNAPYSGTIRISLLRLRVYDFFMIFSSSKKLENVMREVIVLPVPKKMNIAMPPFGTYTNEPVAQSTSDKKGDDQSEIRLIREYREGDLTRHMHRNYSARTEKIWIKEFQKENDYICSMTPVVAVMIPDVVGGLNKVLNALTAAKVNLEYMYSTLTGKQSGNAYMSLRVENILKAEEALRAAGFKLADQDSMSELV